MRKIHQPGAAPIEAQPESNSELTRREAITLGIAGIVLGTRGVWGIGEDCTSRLKKDKAREHMQELIERLEPATLTVSPEGNIEPTELLKAINNRYAKVNRYIPPFTGIELSEKKIIGITQNGERIIVGALGKDVKGNPWIVIQEGKPEDRSDSLWENSDTLESIWWVKDPQQQWQTQEHRINHSGIRYSRTGLRPHRDKRYISRIEETLTTQQDAYFRKTSPDGEEQKFEYRHN